MLIHAPPPLENSPCFGCGHLFSSDFMLFAFCLSDDEQLHHGDDFKDKSNEPKWPEHKRLKPIKNDHIFCLVQASKTDCSREHALQGKQGEPSKPPEAKRTTPSSLQHSQRAGQTFWTPIKKESSLSHSMFAAARIARPLTTRLAHAHFPTTQTFRSQAFSIAKMTLTTLPSVEVMQGFPDVQKINISDYCAGKNVIIVGLPGAFTPT